MKIIKGNVFFDNNKFEKRDIYIENGIFCENESGGGDIFDAEGCYVLPGFIDIHIHGCTNADASSGDIGDFEKMSSFLATKGITGFCPTTMTLPIEQLEKAFIAADKFRQTQVSGSRLLGINMEGPYFSMAKKGAQNPEYIKNPTIEEFDRLWKSSNGVIALADVAPELPGAEKFIKHVSKLTTVSLAHTSADYSTAKAALEAGATNATHLFNAMTPFTHRDPGVPGAVFESDCCFAELICDCIHIHPAVIKTVFKILGDDRVCVISDNIPCAGLPEGKYTSGGLEVYLKDGCAKLADGTLAGSASLLNTNFKNVAKLVSLESAIKACSANPAKNIGVYNKTGSISYGKFGDVVIIDKNLDIKSVFIAGKLVF